MEGDERDEEDGGSVVQMRQLDIKCYKGLIGGTIGQRAVEHAKCHVGEGTNDADDGSPRSGVPLRFVSGC